MKKTLSLILALLMSVSCASTIFADDAAIADEEAVVEEIAAIEDDVEDAEEATPYDRAIKFLNEYKIMKGMEDGLLHAEKEVKRYEMALFTGRIATGWVDDDTWEDFDANDSGFADLKGTGAENVYGAMSYVSQKGIIEGYPDGNFKPEQVVTYREALTMAVRTLGYQGLEFPWGYIEKAVSLGLTDGITGVAYTDVINRGVAAQIIYNAMFADNSKLGLANFGRAFGWANILVTSTVVNDTTILKDETDVRATYTNAEYKTPTGYISFQVIEKDGTLSDDIYYVKASEMDLDEGHADELALGTPYAALFEIDEDDNYVELVAVEAAPMATIKNEGRTDNDGVAYDTVDNIKAFMADYTLVDKYSSKILANTGKLANEIIIGQAANLTKIEIDYSKTPYAFDWETGDILLWNEDEEVYEVEWYYNSESDFYFDIKTKTVVDEDGEEVEKFVGIEIMDEKDVVELRKAIDKACETEVGDGLGYVSANIGGIYANLDVYNLDGDDLAEYGVYESYTFGKIGQKNDDAYKCKKCDAKRDFLTINGQYKGFLESADCGADEHFDGIWWQDEYAPVLDEDGKIVSAYVIYGLNAVTKELKVIKTIEAYSDDLVDADTYYATGILRGYSISKGYVMIGDQKIYFNEDFGTFNLDAEKVVMDDGSTVTYNKDNKGQYRAYLTDVFDGLFNQFVRYYLLDGKVVKIETVGATNDEFIVVESYAGISNDGYIVINGYSTSDLKLDRFRIAVYNDWANGDYFWYGYQNEAKEAFVKGNVYAITSYDEENDLYFVDTLAEWDDDEMSIDTDKISKEVKRYNVYFEDGYRFFDDVDKTDEDHPYKKMKSDDKYVLVGAVKNGYMPIAVFEGKVPESTPAWTFTGDLIVGATDKNTLVFVNCEGVVGFNYDSAANSGIVAVLDYTVLDKFYDGFSGNEDEWYLNGATEYGNVLVFNFLSGKFEDVATATNIKVKEGYVYKTIDGVIVDGAVDKSLDQFDVAIWTLIAAYGDNDIRTADYMLDGFTLNTDEDSKWYYKNILWDNDSNEDERDNLSKNQVSKDIYEFSKEYKGLVSNLKVVKVDTKDGLIDSIEVYTEDDFEDAMEDNGLLEVDCTVVYKVNDETVDAVVYVDSRYDYSDDEADESTTAKSENVIGLASDAAIGAEVEATKHTVTEDGNKSVYYTIDNIGFNYFGSAMKDNHANLAKEHYYFDILGRCDVNDNLNGRYMIHNADDDNWYDEEERVYDTDIEFVVHEYDEDVCDAEHCFYDDEKLCALISAFNFDVKNVKVVEDEYTWVRFQIDDLKGNEDWTLTLRFEIVDGALVVKFAGPANGGNGDNLVNDVDLNQYFDLRTNIN